MPPKPRRKAQQTSQKKKSKNNQHSPNVGGYDVMGMADNLSQKLEEALPHADPALRVIMAVVIASLIFSRLLFTRMTPLRQPLDGANFSSLFEKLFPLMEAFDESSISTRLDLSLRSLRDKHEKIIQYDVLKGTPSHTRLPHSAQYLGESPVMFIHAISDPKKASLPHTVFVLPYVPYSPDKHECFDTSGDPRVYTPRAVAQTAAAAIAAFDAALTGGATNIGLALVPTPACGITQLTHATSFFAARAEAAVLLAPGSGSPNARLGIVHSSPAFLPVLTSIERLPSAPWAISEGYEDIFQKYAPREGLSGLHATLAAIPGGLFKEQREAPPSIGLAADIEAVFLATGRPELLHHTRQIDHSVAFGGADLGAAVGRHSGHRILSRDTTTLLSTAFVTVGALVVAGGFFHVLEGFKFSLKPYIGGIAISATTPPVMFAAVIVVAFFIGLVIFPSFSASAIGSFIATHPTALTFILFVIVSLAIFGTALVMPLWLIRGLTDFDGKIGLSYDTMSAVLTFCMMISAAIAGQMPENILPAPVRGIFVVGAIITGVIYLLVGIIARHILSRRFTSLKPEVVYDIFINMCGFALVTLAVFNVREFLLFATFSSNKGVTQIPSPFGGSLFNAGMGRLVVSLTYATLPFLQASIFMAIQAVRLPHLSRSFRLTIYILLLTVIPYIIMSSSFMVWQSQITPAISYLTYDSQAHKVSMEMIPGFAKGTPHAWRRGTDMFALPKSGKFDEDDFVSMYPLDLDEDVIQPFVDFACVYSAHQNMRTLYDCLLRTSVGTATEIALPSTVRVRIPVAEDASWCLAQDSGDKKNCIIEKTFGYESNALIVDMPSPTKQTVVDDEGYPVDIDVAQVRFNIMINRGAAPLDGEFSAYAHFPIINSIEEIQHEQREHDDDSTDHDRLEMKFGLRMRDEYTTDRDLDNARPTMAWYMRAISRAGLAPQASPIVFIPTLKVATGSFVPTFENILLPDDE